MREKQRSGQPKVSPEAQRRGFFGVASRIADTVRLQPRQVILNFFHEFFRFWYLDLLVRVLFYIFLLIVGIMLYLLVTDREYLFTLIVDIYYSAKFLISNNLVIRRGVIAACNRS